MNERTETADSKNVRLGAHLDVDGAGLVVAAREVSQPQIRYVLVQKGGGMPSLADTATTTTATTTTTTLLLLLLLLAPLHLPLVSGSPWRSPPLRNE